MLENCAPAPRPARVTHRVPAQRALLLRAYACRACVHTGLGAGTRQWQWRHDACYIRYILSAFPVSLSTINFVLIPNHRSCMFNILSIVLNRNHIVVGHCTNFYHDKIYYCILERDDRFMHLYIYSLVLSLSQLLRFLVQ